jgi:hypothetical protein
VSSATPKRRESLISRAPAGCERESTSRVGSEVFRWTDSQRPETLTANASDRRQVIAQALCADLASRGYVVVALCAPYESGVSVLARGQVVGQTTHPDVMGPPPHPDLER